MNTADWFFYFKPFGCSPTLYEVAKEAEKYGKYNDYYRSYIDKEMRKFEKNLKLRMQQIAGSTYAYTKYGVFGYYELMEIMETQKIVEQYRDWLDSASTQYSLHKDIIKSVLDGISQFMKENK